MYRIEQTYYGFKISAWDSMTMDDADQMLVDLTENLSQKDGPFSMVIDTREMVPFEPEVAQKIVEAHVLCLQMNCERTAILVKSPVARGQASQICFSASPMDCDRVINASTDPDWEEKAVAWAAEGVEPGIETIPEKTVS
jgi:hypothetical protein